MRALFVQGLPDDNTMHAVVRDGQLRQVLLGSANVYQALASDPDLQSATMTLLGEGPDVPIRWDSLPDVIFNEISDPDANGIALTRAEQFYEHCRGVAVINQPAAVRRSARDQLADALQGSSHVIAPRTLRRALTSPTQVDEAVQSSQLQYPILVRIAGLHGGKSLVRVEQAGDHDQLHALPFDGRDFYISSFYDFRSADGLYRKYRILVVDKHPLARHVLISESWLVNASSSSPLMLARPELLDEEAKILKTFDREIAPQLQPAITEIADATGLDYFGIDGHVTDDGQLVLFEANANVNALNASNARSHFVDASDLVRQATAQIKQLIVARATASNG